MTCLPERNCSRETCLVCCAVRKKGRGRSLSKHKPSAFCASVLTLGTASAASSSSSSLYAIKVFLFCLLIFALGEEITTTTTIVQERIKRQEFMRAEPLKKKDDDDDDALVNYVCRAPSNETCK